MLIPIHAQPEKAMAKEAGRYAMHYVRFERVSPVTNGPALVATNGRILALVPVEAEEHDADGWISAEALKEARKRGKKGRHLNGARLVANGALAVYDRPSTALPERPANSAIVGRTIHGTNVEVVPASGPMLPPEPDTSTPCVTLQRPMHEGEFPRYSAAIPPADRPEARISFNPDFLSDLADALGSSSEARCVTLGIATRPDGTLNREAPIRVTTSTQGAIGVLMPVTIDDERREPHSSDPARIPLALDRADKALQYVLETLPHKPQDAEQRERSDRARLVMRQLVARLDELRAELIPQETPPACSPDELVRPSGHVQPS